MGSASSKPDEAQTASPSSDPNPVTSTTPSDSAGCPVKHGSGSTTSRTSKAQEGCPVKHQQYNVYSQPIDPKNQMPAIANQLPSPNQKVELPTERAKSTIPKGGAEEGITWTYPSPQMFYNALSRKNKLGSTTEDIESDIESVVALHNNMNERTWAKVKEWEEVTAAGQKSSSPKLLKFMGRPSDLSPKARFKHWMLGHPLPFDRHDWTILREDGTQVRYVIDYYHDESRAQEEENTGMPDMHDFRATPSLLVDVRPALDGPAAVWDRAVRMPYARHVAQTTSFQPLPLVPTFQMKSQVQESLQVWDNIQKAKQQKLRDDEETMMEISNQEAVAICKTFGQMLNKCQEVQVKMNQCTSDEECARASMDLTLCMAKILCPLQHSAMVNSLLSSNDDESEEEYNLRLEAALENMSDCVAGVSQRAQLAKKAHPGAFTELDSENE